MHVQVSEVHDVFENLANALNLFTINLNIETTT